MNFEPKTPEEIRFRDFFKKEFLPMIRQFQEEVLEEAREEGRKEVKAEIEARVKAETEARVKAETVQSFISKMPDMSDADVAGLFDVTPGYVKDLRKKIQNG